MKITERKEVTHVEIKDVIIGRKCDICGGNITESKSGGYNYFLIHTWHNDWGNDSIDSHEYMDACSPECVMKFTEEYVRDSFIRKSNTKSIEIEHVMSLADGAHD